MSKQNLKNGNLGFIKAQITIMQKGTIIPINAINTSEIVIGGIPSLVLGL